MIRVVVADDQALVRMGLRTLFEAEPDTELVGEAVDGIEAIDVTRAAQPDVVLMDIRMPRLDGLAALCEITADPGLASVRVIIVTTFELDEYVFVAWVATGRSNDEIAAALVVSPATVRTHVSRAMLKLHARDRAQLVVFAVQSRLMLPPGESDALRG